MSACASKVPPAAPASSAGTLPGDSNDGTSGGSIPGAAAVRAAGAPGAAVLVMDRFRPESVAAAQAIVDQYAANEPEVLRLDFLASLCAAFEPDEIRAQLQAHGLDGFGVRTVSDRHLLITGRLPPR